MKRFFSLKVQLFFRWLSYVAFLGYGIYVYVTEKKLFILIGTLVLLIGALYFEYLKFLHRKALFKVNFDVESELAKQQFNQLLKLDVFKTFKHEKIVFDALVSLHEFNTEQTISLINNYPKIFNANVDQLLLGKGLLFLAYAYSHQKGKAEKCYFEMVQCQNVKVQGKKVSPLFNDEVMRGIYYSMKNDLKKAMTAFENVNVTTLNHREMAEYAYFYALTAKRFGNENVFYKQRQRLLSLAPKSQFVVRLDYEGRL